MWKSFFSVFLPRSASVDQVFEHRFPTLAPPCWLFNCRERAHVLANRLGVTLEVWEDDGLGTARGFFLRLSSERIVLFCEHDHLVERSDAGALHVQVDAGDVVDRGVAGLVTEILSDIGLRGDAVVWQEKEAHRDHLVKLLAVRDRSI